MILEARRARIGVDALDDIQVIERRFALLHQQSAGSEGAMAVTIEGGGEQAFGGADRIGAIDDDHIERPRRRLLHPANPVLEQQGRARILVRFGQLGKEGLGDAGDALVDIDLQRRLDLGVAQHLAQGAAVAAADDRDPFGLGMGEQHGMREHLVIEEVLPAREHREAVDDHQMAEGLGGVDLDGLERGLFVMQTALDAQ